MSRSEKPGLLRSLLSFKCPHCRQGDLFNVKNPYRLKHLFEMPERCPVCGQQIMLEVGFWYGTGYVSYGLALAVSAFTFFLYWLIFGLSWRNDSIYYWLLANSVILFLAMPWLIRLSRVIYLGIFVRYDPAAAKAANTRQ